MLTHCRLRWPHHCFGYIGAITPADSGVAARGLRVLGRPGRIVANPPIQVGSITASHSISLYSYYNGAIRLMS